MKKISTRNAILAGIFGWFSFLLVDSICFALLTMKFTWQPAAIISAVLGAWRRAGFLIVSRETKRLVFVFCLFF